MKGEGDARNNMESLYADFRESLSNHDGPLYYDETELIDIFDYAGDVHDDYVRQEALALGARLFPESDDLAKRHAILLADVSEEAFRAYMNDHKADKNDILWAILRCRAESPVDDDAVRRLLEIVEIGLDDDEPIIQFVALVKQLGMMKWLADSLPIVRDHCAYQPTLLFEIARLAEAEDEIVFGITLLEELTMADPFNIEYWALLAELQSNLDRYDDALTTIDYAKAIDPDDYELLSLEGYIYVKQQKPKEAIVVLEKSLSINPSFYPARRSLLEAKIMTDSNDVGALTAELNAMDPADRTLTRLNLCFNPDNAENILTRYFSEVPPEETTVIQLAYEICSMERPKIALKVIDWYRQSCQRTVTTGSARVEILYISKEYAEAVKAAADLSETPLTPSDFPILAIIASAMLKLRLYDETMEFCDLWIERLSAPDCAQGPLRLINRGLLETLRDMRRLLVAHADPTNEQIDAVCL